MSINDAAGVSALLERLRSSQAWQEAIGTAATTSASTANTTPASSSSKAPLTVPSYPTEISQVLAKASSDIDSDTDRDPDDRDINQRDTNPIPTVSSVAGGVRTSSDTQLPLSSTSADFSTLPSLSGPSASSATSVSIASLLSQLQPAPTLADSDSASSISSRIHVDADRYHEHEPVSAPIPALTPPNIHSNPNPNPNPIRDATQQRQHLDPGFGGAVPTPLSSNMHGTWSSFHSQTQSQFRENSTSDVPMHIIPMHEPTPQVTDRRHFSFQQALPVVAKLSEDESFIKALASMKKEQEKLERRLWEERCAIIRKYENKVKTAMTKATMTGAPGLSKHESTMLSDACKKELRRFDSERVLVAWDGLITQQQEHLARLGVPTMFVTDVVADRETQQKVMQVLDGLA